jgi:hypothetical protein
LIGVTVILFCVNRHALSLDRPGLYILE